MLLVNGTNVQFPVDLRMHLDDKISLAKSAQTYWTAFVNNNGKLCHLVNSDGILVRLTFKSSIKHLSITKMRAEITFRLKTWIKHV